MIVTAKGVTITDTGTINFGWAAANTRAGRIIELTNDGESEIELTAITVAGDFSLDSVSDLPAEGGAIPTGETRQLRIAMNTKISGVESRPEGTLAIEGDEAFGATLVGHVEDMAANRAAGG